MNLKEIVQVIVGITLVFGFVILIAVGIAFIQSWQEEYTKKEYMGCLKKTKDAEWCYDKFIAR